MAKSITLNATSSVYIYPFTVLQTGNSSTLNGDINSSVTTITLVDASTFASSGSIRIGEELITYTGKSGNNLTGCTRNYYYSSTLSHTSGDTVYEVTCTLGTNQSANTAWDYFNDSADVGSAIYFSSVQYYSPTISGLQFYVGTAMASTSHTLVLEAYDRRGGDWTELPNQIDNTNQLTTTGQNWWTFNTPWWFGSLTMSEVGLGATMPCRLRLKAVSGLTEGGANSTQIVHKRHDTIVISGGTSGDPVTMTNIYDAMISAGWTDVIERSATSGKDDLICNGNYFFINGFIIYLSGGCVFSSSYEIILFRTGHFDGDNNTSNVVKITRSVLVVGGFGYNMNIYWSGAYRYEFSDACLFMSGQQFANYSANFVFTKSILTGAGDGNFYGGYTQQWDRSVTWFVPNTYTAPSVRDWTFNGSNISGVAAYQNLTGLVIRDATIDDVTCNENTTNVLYDVNAAIYYGYQHVGGGDMNLYIHYSVTLLVVDEAGNAIENAQVTYSDVNGDTVQRWEGTIGSGGLVDLDPVLTNASGYTDAEDILYRHTLLTHPGPASYTATTNYYYPTTMKIEKAGYLPETLTVTVDVKRTNVIVLKRATMQIDQEGGIS